MDLPLPFHSIRNSEFRKICGSGRRTLDLIDIWAGRKNVRNEWAQAIIIDLRKAHYKREKKDLSILLRQPAEIIYEVLGHLHPIDIYHLFLASKEYEEMLSAPNKSWLWSRSFGRYPGIPPCPAGIGYPSWADLLFGPYTCDVRLVSSKLLQNLCLYTCSQYPGLFGSVCSPKLALQKTFMSAMCQTKVGIFLQNPLLQPLYFFYSDFDVMRYRRYYERVEAEENWDYEPDERSFCAEVLMDIESAITGENMPTSTSVPLALLSLWTIPGPRDMAINLQDVADHLIAFLRCDYEAGLRKLREDSMTQYLLFYLVEYHRACVGWGQTMKGVVKDQELDHKRQIISWARQKRGFSKYDDETWMCLLDSIDCFWESLNIDRRHPFRSLRRRWRDYSSNLTIRLNQFAEARDDAYEQARLLGRREDIMELHNALHNQMMAHNANHPALRMPIPEGVFPSSPELLLFTPFIDILVAEEPDFEDPSTDTINDWIMKYRALMPKWRPKTMQDLSELCPMIKIPPCMKKYPRIQISSAAAIFYCTGCHAGTNFKNSIFSSTPFSSREVLIGWEKAIEHLKRGCRFLRLPDPFRVHERASEASILALRLLGENPTNVEEDEMELYREEHHTRLSCLNCPDIFRLSMAMCWEDCIAHTIVFQDDPTHQTPRWRKVALGKVIKRDIISVFC